MVLKKLSKKQVVFVKKGKIMWFKMVTSWNSALTSKLINN